MSGKGGSTFSCWGPWPHRTSPGPRDRKANATMDPFRQDLVGEGERRIIPNGRVREGEPIRVTIHVPDSGRS
jgi:hypothetical protein